jgi:hypothetical protein
MSVGLLYYDLLKTIFEMIDRKTLVEVALVCKRWCWPQWKNKVQSKMLLHHHILRYVNESFSDTAITWLMIEDLEKWPQRFVDGSYFNNFDLDTSELALKWRDDLMSVWKDDMFVPQMINFKSLFRYRKTIILHSYRQRMTITAFARTSKSEIAITINDKTAIAFMNLELS